MRVYLDTSAIAKLYYPEPESAQVASWVREHDVPILFTALHELELATALALKRWRRELTLGQHRAVLRLVAGDVERGVLARVTVDWGAALALATELSGQHSPRVGSRSLDVLHIAVAQTLNCTALLSFDTRQQQLARRAGFSLVRS